ncbi:MAG TPA: hypothetical protein VFN28_08860 [Amaricoccus sp.]|nr:hypothetical protein [Amaricoccus sp.]
MTALDRYVRLEAVGLWREAPDAPPREVVISFGKTTLLLTDLDERPLGHWALAGVRTLGEEPGGATVYAMSAGETLTIHDREMVAAIDAVRRRLPEPGRPRRRLPAGAILALVLLAAAIAWGPRLVRAAAERLVPPEQAAEIGDRMLIALIETHGPPCDAPEAGRALGRLAAALVPAMPPRLRVIDLGHAPAVAALPGGTILIDRETATTAPPPELAGRVAAAIASDPVAALVEDAGLAAAVRYIFTGRFSERTLARAAESVAARTAGFAPVAVPEGVAAELEVLRDICP